MLYSSITSMCLTHICMWMSKVLVSLFVIVLKDTIPGQLNEKARRGMDQGILTETFNGCFDVN